MGGDMCTPCSYRCTHFVDIETCAPINIGCAYINSHIYL